MAEQVEVGVVAVPYAIWKYENYFGEGKHAYDVIADGFESDYVFDTVVEAGQWLAKQGRVKPEGV